MPFPFSYVCDLLEDLHRLHVQDHPLLPRDLEKRTVNRANRWLRDHKIELNAFNTQQNAALWVLRPDKLGDREYGITANTLQLIIARIYKLSREECLKLRRWESRAQGLDLAACVEEVREDIKVISSPRAHNRVTVEEIYNSLLQIAAFNPRSSPAIQSLAQHRDKPADTIELLDRIYGRLPGREAKWLTRFILKDYGAVLLPDKWNWQPGYSGMPNCAEMTIDIFTRPPPCEILDGTKRTRPLSETNKCASESRQRVLETGWPVRTTIRSREKSPIQPPIFAKGLLKPNQNSPIHKISSPRGTEVLEPPSVSEPNTTTNLSQLVPTPISQTSTNIPPFGIEPKSSIGVRKTPKSPTTSNALPSAANMLTEGVKWSGCVNTQHLVSSSGCSKVTALPSELTKMSKKLTAALSNIFSNATIHNEISPNRANPTKSPNRRRSNPLITAGTGTCRITSSECSLASCIFLLAPSVTESSRLINELLPWHGVQYLTDFRGLANPHLPGRCPRTQLRYKKIVLIDTYEREETVEFIKQIKSLNLRTRSKRRKPDGKGSPWTKEFVEVYDWRLLEAIAKMDRGKQYDYDPWRRNLIGPI